MSTLSCCAPQRWTGSAVHPPRGDMERVDGAPLSVGLAQHTARRTVAKAADSAVRPEVVIEGAVLLDQDHDALDIAEPRGARPPDERIEGEARADGKARGEELAAGESGVTHGPAYSTGAGSSARWPPASPTAPTTGHPSDVRGAELPGPTGWAEISRGRRRSGSSDTRRGTSGLWP